MAFSDILDTHSMRDAEQDDSSEEKRVCLPKPDVNNITVLTESLPNEPILPWHHFDSPWLEREEGQDADAIAEAEPSGEAAPAVEPVQQLTLPLDAPPTPSEVMLDASTHQPWPVPTQSSGLSSDS